MKIILLKNCPTLTMRIRWGVSLSPLFHGVLNDLYNKFSNNAQKKTDQTFFLCGDHKKDTRGKSNLN